MFYVTLRAQNKCTITHEDYAKFSNMSLHSKIVKSTLIMLGLGIGKMGPKLHVLDYVVFAASIVISVGIGAWYARPTAGQQTAGKNRI